MLSVLSKPDRSKYEDLDRTNWAPEVRSVDMVANGIDEFINSPGAEIEMTAASVSGIIPDDTFTVDQAVDALGFGRFQIILSLITGLFWMADSMEMMILSILSPALSCEWGIQSWQQALITTVVFFGMMVSATLWGFLSDRYGRKLTIFISSIFLFFFGFLSSFAPTYVWLLVLRCLVGFAVGCVPQGVTLYAEFLPMTQRAKCVVLLDSFWALGACFEVVLAIFVMPTLGWRWLLGLSSLPLLLFICVCPLLPESARFSAASGNSERAVTTLKQIAKQNRKQMLPGRLILDDVQNVKRGMIKDLLIPSLRRTSLLLWIIWFVCAFSYYGIVLMTTEIFSVNDPCHGTILSNSTSNSSACKVLKTDDYVDLLWTTIAEFPGIFVTLFVIEKLGRRKTIVMEFILFSASVLLLFICTHSRRAVTVIIFVARAIVSGVFQAVYVYTPEVYPTTLRAVGIGTCSSMARVGAMITPFIAQVLLPVSVDATLAIYACSGLIAAAAAALLPIETKGRAMQELHS